jgi:hypothetical protein
MDKLKKETKKSRKKSKEDGRFGRREINADNSDTLDF